MVAQLDRSSRHRNADCELNWETSHGRPGEEASAACLHHDPVAGQYLLQCVQVIGVRAVPYLRGDGPRRRRCLAVVGRVVRRGAGPLGDEIPGYQGDGDPRRPALHPHLGDRG